MSFFSLYDQGFARVAALTFPVSLANPLQNAEKIVQLWQQCSAQKVAVAVTPELSLTGYSNDDLFLQDRLREATILALEFLRTQSRDLFSLLVVGAPLALENRLFNCAVFIHRGQILAITPKYHLPNYREFYDKRYFSTISLTDLQWVHWDSRRGLTLAANQKANSSSNPSFEAISSICSHESSQMENNRTAQAIPFGLVQLRAVDVPHLNIAAEICEDMWVPIAPSMLQALRGATVIANLSASPATVGRSKQREETVKSLSTRNQVAYVYTAAGLGESSTDLSWDGQSLIYEAGQALSKSARFSGESQLSIADVDVQSLHRARLQQNSFADNATSLRVNDFQLATVEFRLEDSNSQDNASKSKSSASIFELDLGLLRPISRFPFVPDDSRQLDVDCWESFHIQVSALQRRMSSSGTQKLVIGVSGGLDSTHALLVAARTLDVLGLERKNILAYTMPGFGTTARSRTDAQELCEVLGVSFAELDIRPAAQQMLQTMGHPASQGAAHYDITYENVQAGLRTDYLFRLANQHHAIVVGTGDLSELALGWCTYGVGDQMSHYGVNVGLPKTMMQHIIRWVAAVGVFGDQVVPVLENIVTAEISPELVPPEAADKPQSTQSAIGPYALHDFTLFYVLNHGMSPRRIAFLAQHAWQDASQGCWPQGIRESERDAFDLSQILSWMHVLFARFFGNQFKRSAIPNGPKMMAGGALSPRGDWRMPSDAQAAAWLTEIVDLAAELGLQLNAN